MDEVIPVALRSEPDTFDRDVRQKGLARLKAKGVELTGPVPKGFKFKSFWSATNRSLWDAYCGTCAYLAIYFEWVTGASSTDHFVAKSRDASQAYEWSNYRLSCLGANRTKHKFDDVLDPIGLQPNTFELNLASGAIKPDRTLRERHGEGAFDLARRTIIRLKLDSPDLRQMRQKHFKQYLLHENQDTLRELSPFVWYEAQRQGLL